MNSIQTYKETINLQYDNLTKSEKKIADYILVSGDEIIYETSSELIGNVKVGEGTLNRFCKKIGFSGFHEFKLKTTKDILGADSNQLSNDTYIDEIQNNYISIINNTRKLIDQQELDGAIELINSSKNILIIGVGASGNAARECEISLLRIGKIVKSVIDTHLQLIHTALLEENDLIIAFSLSGSTKEIVECLSYARERNVKVISITNYSSRKVAKLSDCVLLTSKKESYLEGGSLTAKISQIFLIDVICTGISLLNYQSTVHHKEEIATILSKKID